MKKELRSEFFAWFKGLSESEISDLVGNMPVHNPEGHQLSDKNNALLNFQNPEMKFTVVAGFQQWISHGRCVKKGQKGTFIFFPSITKAKKDDQGNETSPESERFLMVPVFDISQTFEIKEDTSKPVSNKKGSKEPVELAF